MAYLDLVFHNIFHQQQNVNQAHQYQWYSNYANTVNRRDRIIGGANLVGMDSGWGDSATGVGAAAIFLCESPFYENYHANFNVGGMNVAWAPVQGINNVCAFIPGQTDGNLIPALPPPAGLGWSYRDGFHVRGTNIRYGGAAPPGSDRYALQFQARWRFHQSQRIIRGLFVHVKNTNADPGTQIAALCRDFPDHLIFGDLNLNVSQILKKESLEAAISDTHRLLALRNNAGEFYSTRTNGNGPHAAWISTLDYILVPIVFQHHVEIRSSRLAGAVDTLERHGSDHSVMVMRVRCEPHIVPMAID